MAQTRIATVGSSLRPVMTCQQQTWQPAATTGKVHHVTASILQQLSAFTRLIDRHGGQTHLIQSVRRHVK